MAVYTHLSETDLAALLAHYDLGAVQAFTPIAEGIENSNFALTTARGRFVLTLFEKRVTEAELPFFMNAMAYLAWRNCPVPRPVKLRDGGYVAGVKGKPAAIVSFLDGEWPRAPTIAHCAKVGDMLAGTHVAALDCPHWRVNALGPEGWEGLIRPRLDVAERLRPGLAAEIARDLDEVRAAWPDDLQRGLIHADLFPDNVLFSGERITGVIDWYFACTDFRAYDIAVALNAWCFDGARDWNAEKANALIESYHRARMLDPEERAALPLLARGAALRFFATRLADWDATPAGALVKPKDPLEYARKLDFWRTNPPTSAS